MTLPSINPVSPPLTACPLSDRKVENPVSAPVLRLTLHRWQWPSTAAQPSRAGLALRWNVALPDGEILVDKSTHPFFDGALALLDRGVSPDTLITARHADKAFDSFQPQKLGSVAEPWKRRREKVAADVARLKARKDAQSARTAL